MPQIDSSGPGPEAGRGWASRASLTCRSVGRNPASGRLIPVMACLSLVGFGCRSGVASHAAAGHRVRPTTATSPQATTPPSSLLPPPGPEGARAVVSPSGVIVPVLATVPNGWLVRTPCHATTTLPRGTPVGRTTVVLDPGHGGTERGAIAASGLAEADVNLQVARLAKDALQAAGVTVLLTRTGDYDLDLATRAEIVTRVAPLAFVSVHHNAAPDRSRASPGSETYYRARLGELETVGRAGLRGGDIGPLSLPGRLGGLPRWRGSESGRDRWRLLRHAPLDRSCCRRAGRAGLHLQPTRGRTTGSP